MLMLGPVLAAAVTVLSSGGILGRLSEALVPEVLDTSESVLEAVLAVDWVWPFTLAA
jgi:hypothetical protein